MFIAGLAALSLSALGCNDTRTYPPCPLGVSPSGYDCIPTYSPEGLVNVDPNSPGYNADVGRWLDANPSADLDAAQGDGGAGGGNAVGGRDGGGNGGGGSTGGDVWDPNIERPSCREIFACTLACEDDACVEACDDNATLWNLDRATRGLDCARRECTADPSDTSCLFAECSTEYEQCQYGSRGECYLGNPIDVRHANESLHAVAAQCSRECDTLGEMGICAGVCVKQALPLAYTNCRDCTGLLVLCLANRCPEACEDGGSTECDACLERMGCVSAFEACVE